MVIKVARVAEKIEALPPERDRRSPSDRYESLG
jgi:hypothetical protein